MPTNVTHRHNTEYIYENGSEKIVHSKFNPSIGVYTHTHTPDGERTDWAKCGHCYSDDIAQL